jgi:2-polyprenyl-3-methyl-5-hydroxy-6-metoxy-1,4-benzoquinol methylase
VKWVNEKQKGMAYQKFRVMPLTPLNPETAKRLEQLQNDLKLVKEKTVLDIGCHAGLASVVALECGARKVLATDVTQEYLGDLNKFSESTEQPLSTEHVSFLDLNERHTSQVVIFLEVYHWLAAQGVAPTVVANKLNELATDHIIFESPLDRSDPSVVRAMGDRSADYNLFQILDVLLAKGWRIEFTGLASYFPSEYVRGRFLLTRIINP